MTETTKTNRFSLFLFLYYLIVPLVLSYLPGLSALPMGYYLLIAQFITAFPPILLYFLRTKKPLRQTLRLNPLGLKNILLILAFSIVVQPLMAFLSLLTSLFFPNPVAESSSNMLSSGLFLSLLAIAVLPALLEEIMMRGIVLSGYERLGKWKSSLLCALLFGMLHMNPQQFLYAFVMGFVFCLLVQRTNSLFASILPHFMINGINVLGIFLQSADSSAAAGAELSMTALFLAVALQALLSLPLLAGLCYLFWKINPASPAVEEDCPSLPHERALTPSLLGVFAIYFFFGFLPYLFL